MPYSALNPPPLVREQDAHEVLRAAVHNGEMHFSLRRGFTDAGAWGIFSPMQRAMSRRSMRTRT
jgi:hypothetical protein